LPANQLGWIEFGYLSEFPTAWGLNHFIMAQSENAKGIESKFCSKFNNIFEGYC
jgi:hypothetical protein